MRSSRLPDPCFKGSFKAFLGVAVLAMGLSVAGDSFAEKLTLAQMCGMERERHEQKCIADTCHGVCTLEALQKCQRISGTRWTACIRANADMDRSDEPGGPKRPNVRPVRATNKGLSTPPTPPRPGSVPPTNILDASPGFSTTGPAGTGSPAGSGGTTKPGPVFQ